MPFVSGGGTSIGALTMHEHRRQRAGSVTNQPGNVAGFFTGLKQQSRVERPRRFSPGTETASRRRPLDACDNLLARRLTVRRFPVAPNRAHAPPSPRADTQPRDRVTSGREEECSRRAPGPACARSEDVLWFATGILGEGMTVKVEGKPSIRIDAPEKGGY